MRRLWILALASTVLASPAAAQFTTFIAPPSPLKDSIKTAAVTQRLVADSITRSQITDMKTWVDSAAGLPQLRPADTVVKKDTTPAVTTAVSNGVIAPQTASSLPLLLVIGVVTMLMGASLVRRRPPSRADC